jgi:hypothetical protein
VVVEEGAGERVIEVDMLGTVPGVGEGDAVAIEFSERGFLFAEGGEVA